MKVPEKPIGRTAYLSFVECELRDSWNQEIVGILYSIFLKLELLVIQKIMVMVMVMVMVLSDL
jgi:hypothetical protein